MALQKEIWIDHLVSGLFADNSFLSKSFNADDFVVGGKVVHIPNATATPNVEKNRSSLPATVSQLQDKDVTFSIDEFTTDPILIPNADKCELSYDKRESVIGRSRSALYDKVAKAFIASWYPGGGRTIELGRSITRADVRTIDMKFNLEDVPQEDRYLLLNAEMYDHLLGDLTEAQTNAFLAAADAEKGIVGKLYSLNVMLRSKVGSKGDGGAKVDYSLAWHKDYVCRSLGDVDMYERSDDPLFYGDVLSFLVRTGGTTMSSDAVGVYAISEEKVSASHNPDDGE